MREWERRKTLPFSYPALAISLLSGWRTRSWQSRWGLLRLKSRRKALGLRDPLHLDRDRIHGCFDVLQPPIDGTQLPRRHRPRLPPLCDQANHGKSQDDDNQSWDDPREYFVNDKVWIRRHLSP